MTVQDTFIWVLTICACVIGITASIWIVGAIALHGLNVLEKVFIKKEDLDW